MFPGIFFQGQQQVFWGKVYCTDMIQTGSDAKTWIFPSALIFLLMESGL